MTTPPAPRPPVPRSGPHNAHCTTRPIVGFRGRSVFRFSPSAVLRIGERLLTPWRSPAACSADRCIALLGGTAVQTPIVAPCPRCWNATFRTLPRRVVLFLQRHHRAFPIESVSRGSLPRGAAMLYRNRRVRMFQITLARERINAKPNQRVHTLMRTEDATQSRFPRSTPNHLPRAQPAKDATPETMAIQADHAGTARSELRASFPAITATASAKKAILGGRLAV